MEFLKILNLTSITKVQFSTSILSVSPLLICKWQPHKPNRSSYVFGTALTLPSFVSLLSIKEKYCKNMSNLVHESSLTLGSISPPSPLTVLWPWSSPDSSTHTKLLLTVQSFYTLTYWAIL